MRRDRHKPRPGYHYIPHVRPEPDRPLRSASGSSLLMLVAFAILEGPRYPNGLMIVLRECGMEEGKWLKFSSQTCLAGLDRISANLFKSENGF